MHYILTTFCSIEYICVCVPHFLISRSKCQYLLLLNRHWVVFQYKIFTINRMYTRTVQLFSFAQFFFFVRFAVVPCFTAILVSEINNCCLAPKPNDVCICDCFVPILCTFLSIKQLRQKIGFNIFIKYKGKLFLSFISLFSLRCENVYLNPSNVGFVLCMCVFGPKIQMNSNLSVSMAILTM